VERALRLKPDFSQGFNTLGNALMAKGQFEAAADAYRRAWEIDPGFAIAVTNLGNAHRSRGAIDEALRWFETSLTLDPELANTHNSIALVHQAANRHDQAVVALERALELNPDYGEALNNLAISLQEVGQYGQAIQRYRDALAVNPTIAQVYFNLGSLLQTLGRFDESVGVFMQALKVQPDYGAVYSFLAHSLMQQCSWRNLDAVIAKTISHIEHEIEGGESVSASAFALLSMPVPNELRLRAVRRIAERYTDRVAALKPHTRFAYAKPEGGKLRIGYVSPDFRFHSVAVAFKGLLEQHDREGFELFGYSLAAGSGGPTGSDGLTEAFRQDFDSFVELAGLPLDEAARRINDDGINILVDLAGHTRGMRLEIFALEPAPVQAHYLGFSTTIGSDYIHYLITDRIHAPPENEKYYHEKLALLPDSFMATTHSEVPDETPSRAECGLPEGAFVFANFNSHYKFDPWLFTIWMRIMRRVPESVMWFVAGTPTSRDNLRREAEARGIEPERLIFADKVVHGAHLARHRHVDLALDNRYHGGGVTTVDALWMGVPVLTEAGEMPQSRNGATLLSAIGLEELVTESLDDYEGLALALAQDPERLAKVKAKLAANRLTHPLFDIPRLTGHLETAYRMMWENYAAGNPPRTFEVPALP
jgi:predicted O-linked N-acetylglucosamine transferase (SPINDLY family)